MKDVPLCVEGACNKQKLTLYPCGILCLDIPDLVHSSTCNRVSVHHVSNCMGYMVTSKHTPITFKEGGLLNEDHLSQSMTQPVHFSDQSTSILTPHIVLMS